VTAAAAGGHDALEVDVAVDEKLKLVRHSFFKVAD
jgi:hypothetical protein